MIEVQNLTKRYREHVAVDNISFEVGAGEVVGFLGPNGAGKSTTMRVLTGYLPPTTGSARIAGISMFDEPGRAKAHIGYLPEIPPLYADLSIRGYLGFVADLKGLQKGVRRSEIDRVSELAGVFHVRERVIRNLSKGYRQRVGLAQALLGNPPVLILDEPTAGLDPIQIEEVRNLIRNLGEQSSHTIVLSTHILSEVRATCQRIVMIARGKIMADAPIEALEREHNAPLEQVFSKLAVS